MKVGQEFLGMIRPFVFRRYLDYTAIDEIKSMKEKIDISQKRKERGQFNVKLGKGGIREIEFFVQAIQLINGGKDPGIREKSTLKTLHCLRERAYITPEEEMNLKDAYKFLREVEHRLQIFHGRQTQSLPDKVESIEKVAKTLRFKDNPYENFTKKLKKTTDNVHKIYSRLFYEPKKKLEEDASEQILYLLEDENALESLSDYGFVNPEKALHNLKLLSEGPPFAHYSAKARVPFAKDCSFSYYQNHLLSSTRHGTCKYGKVYINCRGKVNAPFPSCRKQDNYGAACKSLRDKRFSFTVSDRASRTPRLLYNP